MHFLKALIFNFFAIFFSNYLIPGIEFTAQKKLPMVGHELLFTFGLALVNALIAPIFHSLLKSNVTFRIIFATLAVNFIAYAGLKIFSLGIHIDHIQSYFIVCIAVSFFSLMITFFTRKHEPSSPEKYSSESPEEPSSSDEESQGS